MNTMTTQYPTVEELRSFLGDDWTVCRATAANLARYGRSPLAPPIIKSRTSDMTTYTIAIGADMLLATVPEGDDIHAAIKTWADETGFDLATPYDVIRHCTLTDQEMDEDFYDVVWKSGNSGFLMDETGSTWTYAVTVA
jgi:hypothetical protein